MNSQTDPGRENVYLKKCSNFQQIQVAITTSQALIIAGTFPYSAILWRVEKYCFNHCWIEHQAGLTRHTV